MVASEINNMGCRLILDRRDPLHGAITQEQEFCAPDKPSISSQLGYLVGHAVRITATKISSFF